MMRWNFAAVVLTAGLLAGMGQSSRAQTDKYKRVFHQSKAAVEQALKELQPAMSGRLPALEGFAQVGDHPLNLYRRGYYQSTVQVRSTASKDSLVQVITKVTAWYADSTPSHSGYQVLISNGRLESDLLDQLADLLVSESNGGSTDRKAHETAIEAPEEDFPKPNRPAEFNTSSSAGAKTEEPGIAAPAPQSQEQPPGSGGAFASSLGQGLPSQHLADTRNSPPTPAEAGLRAEAASLEDVLKNQAHPKNIVAIKQSGAPVVATPSLTGKTLFMASAHDEFEMLDFNADWVHVRISGLSRGWIWRTSLEMPEGISDVPLVNAHAAPVAADLFQVTREETASFPGDWESLRGKNVKIISVQKIQENEANSGPQAKLEFAKALFDKDYADVAAKSQEVAGVVLIFDSVDGGMIAATLDTVRQWKAGAISDAGLWHRCYFDPPETFSLSTQSGH